MRESITPDPLFREGCVSTDPLSVFGFEWRPSRRHSGEGAHGLRHEMIEGNV